MQRPDPKKTNKEWSWSTYFAVKKQKLQLQLDENKDALGDVDENVKFLFKNVGIFVNGFTNPTSIELRALVLKHGGSYHEYMNDNVTHIIASNLAHSKALILKNKSVTKPEWILDSIKEKKLLNSDLYLLQTSAHDKAQNKLTDFIKSNDKDQDFNKLKRLDDIHKNSLENPYQITIDLTDANNPIVQEDNQSKNNYKKNLYEKDYKHFKERMKNFKLNEAPNKYLSKYDTELESLKKMLDDWIFWTSKSNLNRLDKRQVVMINDEDLLVFKGYLLYILNVEKNLENLCTILRIFKRLIEKSGSFEWIENYKDILASVQSDFYEEYNSTLNIN